MKTSHIYNEIAGIIGGIGPEATVYFLSLLTKLSAPYVKKDQDHIPYLVFTNPQVPDRSEYLLKGGKNPLNELVHTGTILKKAGATFLVMPCNTAHVLGDAIEKAVGLPLFNMITLTAEAIVKKYGSDIKVGILATNGTIHAQLYQNALKAIAPDITVLLPDQNTQAKVMDAIYDIKANSVNEANKAGLSTAAEDLFSRGARIIILGCTEIPLALASESSTQSFIDPMKIVAKEVIKKTLASTKNDLDETVRKMI